MLNSDSSSRRILPDAFDDLVHLTKTPFKPKIDL